MINNFLNKVYSKKNVSSINNIAKSDAIDLI